MKSVRRTFALLILNAFLIISCKNNDPKPATSTYIPEPTSVPGVITTIGVVTLDGTTLDAYFKFVFRDTLIKLEVTEGTPLVYSFPKEYSDSVKAFSLIMTPTLTGSLISFNTQNQLSISSSLPYGAYDIRFEYRGTLSGLKLKLDVLPVPPSGLEYGNKTIIGVVGNNLKSQAPQILGSKPISFALVGNNNPSISIDVNTGIVSIASGVNAGVYVLDIEARNASKNVVFEKALTFEALTSAVAPTSLSFTPSSATIDVGNSFKSSNPITNASAPFTFSISVTPTSSFFSVNTATGVVEVSASATGGVYTVSSTIYNELGSYTNDKALIITISAPLIPSQLSYAVNAATITAGNTFTSNTPSIVGTSPFTYSFANNSSPSGVSINASNGVIAASNNVAAGIYTLDVLVSNSAGNAVFEDVFTLTVQSVSGRSFSSDILPILQANCTNCHSQYSNYNTVRSQIGPQSSNNSILNRVNRAQGSSGFMPQGGNKLSQNQLDLLLEWYNTNTLP